MSTRYITTADTVRIEVLGASRAVTLPAGRIIELYDQAKLRPPEATDSQCRLCAAELAGVIHLDFRMIPICHSCCVAITKATVARLDCA